MKNMICIATIVACLVLAQKSKAEEMSATLDPTPTAQLQPLNLELRTAWSARDYKQYHSWSIKGDTTKAEKVFYNHAITFGCMSRHNTGDKPNPYRQVNPCLGFTKFFEMKVLWGTPFIAVREVFRNSRDGTIEAVGVGLEWNIIDGHNVDMIAGFTYTYIWYTDGWSTGKSIEGDAIIPHLGLEKGRFALIVQYLGPKTIGIELRVKF